jgi:hypothetical protein
MSCDEKFNHHMRETKLCIQLKFSILGYRMKNLYVQNLENEL